MTNLKNVRQGAKQFANGSITMKEGASITLDGLGLKANAKTVSEARNRIATEMDKDSIKAEYIKGINSSYAESHSSDDLELALVGSTFVNTKGNDKLKPTKKMSVMDCIDMDKTVYSNLTKPKANVHNFGQAGTSLRAFVEPVRKGAESFRSTNKSRLIAEVSKQYTEACGLVVETDTTSPEALLRSAKTAFKTFSSKCEALKDLKSLEKLNSMDKQYHS